VNLTVILLVSLLLTAFFSGLETAFISADKMRLELQSQTRPFLAWPIRIMVRRPGDFYTTLLTGYYISLAIFVTASVFRLENIMAPPGWLYFLFIIIIIAVSALLISEFLPQIFFRINPVASLILFSFPLVLFYILFYPVTKIVGSIITLFRSTDPENKNMKGKDDRIFTMIGLDHFMETGEQTKSIPVNKVEKEVILFRNALDFSKVKLHEIMVPRNEIAVLNIDSDIETLRKTFVETGFSRILFYEGNVDNIVGYVHSSAIFQKAKSIKPFLKKVLIVPETMAANRLLSRFIRERRSIALVVDEFGGTAGLVTSEDILEEIFGEIEDEYDTIDFTGKKINEKQYVFSGRFEIDVLNEKYNLHIPESENYETLAGFILHHHDSIPKINTTVRIGNLNFKILKASLTKIELVHLTILENW